MKQLKNIAALTTPLLAGLCALGLLVGVPACNGSSTDDDGSGGSEDGSGGSEDGSGGKGSGSGGKGSGSGGNDPSNGGEGGHGGEANTDEGVYLTVLSVYYDTGTQAYALLTNGLDLDISVEDLESATEFAGYSGFNAHGGYVVTGDGEAPFAYKWNITDDLEWEQIGDPLNFTDYFTDDGNGLNFYFQAIRGADLNLFYGADRTSRAHWNTDDWTITGDHEDTNLPLETGYVLDNGGNRTGVRDFVGPVVWPFTWIDEATELSEPTSYLAVYDPETHEEIDVLEVDCPYLQQSTMDEEGNLYFSTTWNDPTFGFYDVGPANCIVRVTPEGELDEDFGTNDLVEWTGSRGINFRYIGGGKALANIAHPERIDGVTYADGIIEGDFDPDVQCAINGCDAAPELYDPTNWSLHLIDVEAGTSEIITGFPEDFGVGNYTITHVIDGRAFIAIQVPSEAEGGEWMVDNELWELDTETATVTLAGKVAGDLSELQRVR